MPLSYADLVASQTANPPTFDKQGMLTATGQSGGQYSPLPQLNPQTGGATYASSQTTDPIANFNMELFKMLQRAQGGNQNAALMGESNTLQNAQLNASTAPGSPGAGGAPLRPGDALAARKDAGNTYSPEIKNITDRMQLNNQAISDFKSALDAAKSFGDDYAKYIKPDDKTIAAVTEQMKAGFIPDQSVLDKVGKYLPTGIWAQAAAAKKAQSSSGTTEGINSQKNQGINEVLDKWHGGYIQGNGKISSKDYQIAKEAWVRKFGKGSAQEFDDQFLGYVDKTSPDWQQDYGITTTTNPPKTPASSAPNFNNL